MENKNLIQFGKDVYIWAKFTLILLGVCGAYMFVKVNLLEDDLIVKIPDAPVLHSKK